MAIKFKNNASTTLAQDITAASTSIVVSAGTGVLFPTLTGSDYFLITVVDGSGNNEIMKVTAVATDTFTVVRAQEGTTARAFAMNSLVELRLTAGAIQEILNVSYATAAEVAAGTEAMKAVAPAVLSSATVAHAATADSAAACTGNAATATDMAAGHVLAGATTDAAVLSKIAPAITTPAQFDNTTKIATTAFVRKASGSLSGFRHVTTSSAMLAGDIGGVVNINNTGVTLTLLDPNTVPYGSTVTIRAQYACTLAAPASTSILSLAGAHATTMALSAATSCVMFATGNAWWAYNGTAVSNISGAGSAMYTTPGTFTFTVPAGVKAITVYVQGGGGSSGKKGGSGNAGGTSSFSVPSVGTLSATGGGGGMGGGTGEGFFVAPAGGVGSGGNLLNASGAPGEATPTTLGANNAGGNPVLFGWGGPPRQAHYSTAGFMGGGASYGPLRETTYTASSGAAGGLAVSTLAVTPGTACTVVVGAGGASPGWDQVVNGAAGGNGYVYIVW